MTDEEFLNGIEEKIALLSSAAYKAQNLAGLNLENVPVHIIIGFERHELARLYILAKRYEEASSISEIHIKINFENISTIDSLVKRIRFTRNERSNE